MAKKFNFGGEIGDISINKRGRALSKGHRRINPGLLGLPVPTVVRPPPINKNVASISPFRPMRLELPKADKGTQMSHSPKEKEATRLLGCELMSHDSEQEARKRIIQVKIQSTVYVTLDDPVSILLPNDPTPNVRLYYRNSELDLNLTFAEQGVLDGCEIRAEPTFTLHCQTPAAEVALKVAGIDSLAKVKMDAAVAACLDLTQGFDLLLNTSILRDDATVAGAGLDSSSQLLLNPILIWKSITRTPESQGVLHYVFQKMVPGVTIITTDMTTSQLQELGFGRHILDPIMFYKMTLVYRTSMESKSDNVIMVNAEVVSWKSLSLAIDRRHTILQMKQELSKQLKIKETEQTIIFNGKPLVDSSTLQSCGIADKFSVFVICTGINSYLFLPIDYFDSGGDFDYTKHTQPVNFGKRGGDDYFPPCGWRRYGLKVSGLFEDRSWLGMRSAPGEWIVSYHGARIHKMRTRHSMEEHSGFACGVYSTPHVEDAEAYASPFAWKGKTYKLVFMDRVNPAPEAFQKRKDEGSSEFYISASDEHIRPYGILLKPV